VFIGLGIGALANLFILARAKNQTTTMGMLLLLAPALIVAGEKIETPFLLSPRTEVVQTHAEVHDSPERVWPNILSIDSIQASKPFLMYVGLPIPQRCEMHGQGIGSKRTCYFDVGFIEETVTGWNPPYYMGLSIDRTHMPGRHWLGFESAEYRLEPRGGMTLLTRETTVRSYLHPSWTGVDLSVLESKPNTLTFCETLSSERRINKAFHPPFHQIRNYREQAVAVEKVFVNAN
jgi:hypothetical protein